MQTNHRAEHPTIRRERPTARGGHVRGDVTVRFAAAKALRRLLPGRMAPCVLVASALAFNLFLAACAQGDFGRGRSWFDDADAYGLIAPVAQHADKPRSSYPLTDDERQLRDLAYALVKPLAKRGRGIVPFEYELTGAFRPHAPFDPSLYGTQLLATAYRSADGRYARLNADIRSDVMRIGPFFDMARRVADMDAKRSRSLAYVPVLTRREHHDAVARIAENAGVIASVRCALGERVASYRFALDRLVISTPSPLAVEVEASLKLLEARIADNRAVAGAAVCPAARVPGVAAI